MVTEKCTPIFFTHKTILPENLKIKKKNKDKQWLPKKIMQKNRKNWKNDEYITSITL